MTSPTPRPGQPGEPAYDDRVYRSPMGIAGGALLLALALWIGTDALLNGAGRIRWIAVAGLLLVVPLVVAFTVRPAVYAGADRLRVRNPFRSIELPWSKVAAVRAGYSTEAVAVSGAVYQLWAVPVSLRKRKQAARRQARAATDDPHGRTSVTADVTDAKARRAPADQTVADLRELAERGAGRPGAQGAERVRWAYEVIAPAVLGLLGLIVLIVTG
ncbi:PH domain-containing protein [Streptomyces sp. ODS05-4]|uniref:PH domain-containing protein n=1 Tax=Streptomyces sp. ODS05-4 TaxID=2944939 RepID=UPI0021088B41|nr:PH domain-containing protein [Streptomyces sp. ODS05-4]